MLPEVEKLLRVQHHDQKIKSIDKELAGIPVEAEDIRDRLVADQRAVEAAKGELQQTEVAIKNLELDVSTRRTTIGKLKVQQFETRKNEEYQRMGVEIERYAAEIAALEDREMELMEKADAQKKALEQARARLAEKEVEVKEELEDLESLAVKLKSDRSAEWAERDRLGEGIDSAVLDNYHRLFKSKNGIAVAGLVDEVCQGCHMKVVKSTVIDVKAENHLAHCENCGRILYWWTDERVGKNRGEY
jgi:predicted  nucleic acid-binding Zn-ribbon protein